MTTEAEWQETVKGLLKAEMKRRGLSYEQLAERLGTLGVPTEPKVLRNKVSRGGFSAVFLYQCLKAMGVRT
jgi:transcriptional regulator with XRE-family HTH domain